MSSRATALALMLAALAGCGATSRASGPIHPMVEAAELGTMRNVSESDGVWFGGLPTKGDLELARRRGVRRVIALCDPALYADRGLVAQCEELELELLQLGAPGDGLQIDVAHMLELLAEDARPKTLLFCQDGSVSAMLFAVHRVLHEGVDVEDALVEARRAGMPLGESEDFVRDRVERLGAARSRRR